MRHCEPWKGTSVSNTGVWTGSILSLHNANFK
uniref:Uncharacterized protein n=1 Tax=Anguilla anguilla TaxID=7936 RepID=A0A0E9V0C4_ANGAN